MSISECPSTCSGCPIFVRLVCPSFRLSVDRPAVGPLACLVVWRWVCQASTARSLGLNSSGPPVFPGACLTGGPTFGLLPIGLPFVGLLRYRAGCLSIRWDLIAVRSVVLSLSSGLSFYLSACLSSRHPSAGPSLCRLAAWRSVGPFICRPVRRFVSQNLSSCLFVCRSVRLEVSWSSVGLSLGQPVGSLLDAVCLSADQFRGSSFFSG